MTGSSFIHSRNSTRSHYLMTHRQSSFSNASSIVHISGGTGKITIKKSLDSKSGENSLNNQSIYRYTSPIRHKSQGDSNSPWNTQITKNEINYYSITKDVETKQLSEQFDRNKELDPLKEDPPDLFGETAYECSKNKNDTYDSD